MSRIEQAASERRTARSVIVFRAEHRVERTAIARSGERTATAHCAEQAAVACRDDRSVTARSTREAIAAVRAAQSLDDGGAAMRATAVVVVEGAATAIGVR